MMMSEISVLMVLALCAVGLFLLAWGWSLRRRRRRLARNTASSAEAANTAASATAASASPKAAGAVATVADPMARRLEQRVEALEGRLGEMVDCIGTGNADEKLQAMAGSLLALVRDKNAAMETAMAGLDQLRARLRTLEQMGSTAEVRGIVESLAARVDATQAGQAAAEAGLTARIAALEATEPGAALAGQFNRLIEHKDTALAAVLERLAPLEQRLEELRTAQATESGANVGAVVAEVEPVRLRLATLEMAVEGRDPQPLLDAFGARLDAMQAAQEARLGAIETHAREVDPRAAVERFAERLEAIQARMARLETPEANPFAEISEQLTRLYAQKDAAVEAVFTRLAPLETRVAGIERNLAAADPQAALEGFAVRLETVREAQEARITALEAPQENPFAEISAQLTQLYAQKDAAVDAVLTRLAPLEERLAAFERDLAGRDPEALLTRFAERLDAVRGAHEARLAALEAPRENPFAEISEQLTRLYAQKDAVAERLPALLVPLEERLAAFERDLAGLDPEALLTRFAERLDAVRGAHEARLAALEAPRENPFAEISEQLTRLYAQKDAVAERLPALLAPLETRLDLMERDLAQADPRSALARFAERLEAVQARLADLELPTEPTLTAIAGQLAELQAEKDAAAGDLLARLAPLEGRLVTMEADLAARDPRAAQEAIEGRLETLLVRIGALETPAEDPLDGLRAELARLRSEKDAMMEAVFGRIAPLESRLVQMSDGIAASGPRIAALEAADPQAALSELGVRIAALQAAQGAADGRLAELQAIARDARPFAEISDQLAELHAQKDAAVAAVAARMAPLEARLAEIEARPVPASADEARAHAEEIAAQMIALRAAAAQTELFADRLSLLETSLPRLSAAQALMLKALDRQGLSVPARTVAEPTAVPAAMPEAAPQAAVGATVPAEELSRVISLHQG